MWRADGRGCRPYPREAGRSGLSFAVEPGRRAGRYVIGTWQVDGEDAVPPDNRAGPKGMQDALWHRRDTDRSPFHSIHTFESVDRGAGKIKRRTLNKLQLTPNLKQRHQGIGEQAHAEGVRVVDAVHH